MWWWSLCSGETECFLRQTESVNYEVQKEMYFVLLLSFNPSCQVCPGPPHLDHYPWVCLIVFGSLFKFIYVCWIGVGIPQVHFRPELRFHAWCSKTVVVHHKWLFVGETLHRMNNQHQVVGLEGLMTVAGL